MHFIGTIKYKIMCFKKKLTLPVYVPDHDSGIEFGKVLRQKRTDSTAASGDQHYLTGNILDSIKYCLIIWYYK